MGCQPTHTLHSSIASHVFLLLELLAAIITALRSSISIWSVGLQKIILKMKETFMCNPVLIYLLFHIFTLWSSGLLYIILKWYMWVRVVLLILTYWNHFLCVFAYLLVPSLSQTNMWVLFCLPTAVGSPLGEHLFPSSVPTACWTDPWGQHCCEFNMNTFLLRREEMGICSILQVGRETGGAFPFILEECCQSITVLPTAKLLVFWGTANWRTSGSW